MTSKKAPFDVSDQLREFTEKSVTQAQQAFDNFMNATQEALSNIEASADSAKEESVAFNQKALTFAEENVNTALEFARQMSKAKDMEEILTLQNEYLHKQMEAAGEQARELSDSAGKVISNATKQPFKP